jgi:hypothetical protein
VQEIPLKTRYGIVMCCIACQKQALAKIEMTLIINPDKNESIFLLLKFSQAIYFLTLSAMLSRRINPKKEHNK